MRDAVNEPEKADKLDREFHIMLFSICGNRALMFFSNVFHLLFRRQYREKFLNPDAVLKSVNDHQALTAAIIGGDAAATTEIIRNHILPT
jgi:DNA-binding FadR family transcriptional regulator